MIFAIIFLIASIIYANYSYFDVDKIIKVVIGGCVGSSIGARIMNKIPKFYLAIIFDIFLIGISIKNIFQG